MAGLRVAARRRSRSALATGKGSAPLLRVDRASFDLLCCSAAECAGFVGARVLDAETCARDGDPVREPSVSKSLARHGIVDAVGAA